MPLEREKPVQVRMSDALFTALRSSLDADISRTYSNLVFYSSFGIVRGRISRIMTDSLNSSQESNLENNTSRIRIEPDVLEMEDCEVEHYSNHLPTAHFKKLYVRIEDIQGFAFDIMG
jgi:hypothetical protein